MVTRGERERMGDVSDVRPAVLSFLSTIFPSRAHSMGSAFIPVHAWNFTANVK